MSSHGQISTSRRETIVTFWELPKVPVNLISLSQTNAHFQVIRQFTKPICCEILFVQILAESKWYSIHVIISVMIQRLELVPARLSFTICREESNYSSMGSEPLLCLKWLWMLLDSGPVSYGPLTQAQRSSICKKDVKERLPSQWEEKWGTSPSTLSALESIKTCLTLSKSFRRAILLVTSSCARSSFSCSSLMFASWRRRFSRCGWTKQKKSRESSSQEFVYETQHYCA